jgi:hypothetical protein
MRRNKLRGGLCPNAQSAKASLSAFAFTAQRAPRCVGVAYSRSDTRRAIGNKKCHTSYYKMKNPCYRKVYAGGKRE